MEKQKFELEYSFNTSPKVLYKRLSTPSGLAEWFADDVNLIGKVFTFIWDGSKQEAELINKKDLSHIRFKWKEEHPDKYFEFRVKQDELTGETALMITDFADDDEKEDAIDLWNTQISELKHVIGL